jgi:probable DNA metabolism protein
MLDSTLQSAFDDWRSRARLFLRAGIAPDRTEWSAKAPAAFFTRSAGPQPNATVPRAFLDLAQDAIRHRSDERFTLLYRLLWRLTHGERDLLAQADDPLVRRIAAMAAAVRSEIEETSAALRFRPVGAEAADVWHIAWCAPQHRILDSLVQVFADRRADSRWAILTPARSAYWNRGTLRMADGVPEAAAASDESLEHHWRQHFADLFAPVELPAKEEWAGLPEATLIRPLFRTTATQARRALGMSTTTAEPASPGLAGLRGAIARCRACPLYRSATQAVSGEGPPDARIMLVGEQPGDQEDLAGRPFVGPAGQILDRALAEVGISRTQVYVTNAVKHFKFTPRGKRRIHQKPDLREITACRSWLEHEIALVKPRLVVALGASAARALLGRSLPIGANRGRVYALPSSIPVIVTIHPSYVLRIPEQDKRAAEYARLVADLTAADARVNETAPAEPMLFAAE